MVKTSKRFIELDNVKVGMILDTVIGHTDQEVIELLACYKIEAEALCPGMLRSPVTRYQLDLIPREQYTELSDKLARIAIITPLTKMALK